MKISELKNHIQSSLKETGIEEADSDTGIILREFANVTLSDLFSDPDRELDASVDTGRIEEVISLRVKRIPLQHIVGKTCFMGFDFEVSPDALIPRPDTEILAEEALRDYHDGSKFLDLCTGTGCIITSLIALTNDCYGVGTDISEKALNLAGRNADTILADKRERLDFKQGDLYDALDKGEKFDVIVSNPPYIRTADIEGLMPEVKDHDPILALDGGEDGLVFYRRIIEGAKEHLVKGGDLLLEIGCDQAEDVMKIMETNGFIEIGCIKDFAGNDRVVRGILPLL
ncbi:MAG: peptide chain release factor N(5)-glutamine methyltransferase [Lachnospiraceae bacterium]|nr:peptide chain release factor N(5)-glutamine methyltransferase [Lachnospiraceae bacterium]